LPQAIDAKTAKARPTTAVTDWMVEREMNISFLFLIAI